MPAVRSSVKTSNTINDLLIDRTIEAWQPRFETTLSREDARQIVENVTGFFSILAEWSRAEALDAANDSDDPDLAGEQSEVHYDR